MKLKSTILLSALILTAAAASATPEKGEPAAQASAEATKATSSATSTSPSFSGGAHWYGAELHGHRTASGVVFDKDKLTAAHPFLRFGTKVRVVSKLTKKEVVVEINDRCPERNYRVIDLSEGAAKQIGIWPHAKNGVDCYVLTSASGAKQ